MTDIADFLGHLLWNFWTVLAGSMIAIEPVMRLLWSGYDEWAAKWLSPVRRRKLARIAALGAFLIANYMAFHDAKNQLRKAQGVSVGAPQGRHLTNEQRSRMSAALKLATNENYSVEFNSVPNCEECEDYAQEFREFVSSIPGWKAGGSTLVFSIPFRRGLQMVTRPDEKHAVPALKLAQALESASIYLTHTEEENLQKGVTIIVVARRDR
jgi:hypothetical protein